MTMHYLTLSEQRIMHKALRGSTRIMSDPRQDPQPDQAPPIPPQPDQPPEAPDEPDDDEEKEEAGPRYTLRKIKQTSGWDKKKGHTTQKLWVISRDGKWFDSCLSKQYAKERLAQLRLAQIRRV